MSSRLSVGAIHVTDVRLWAHVGVLDEERELGQWFTLDFSLWLDMSQVSKHDDLSAMADYSLAIKGMQKLALEIRCLTIEYFSEQTLDLIEDLYGAVPMQVILRKMEAPVPGFSGCVAVEKRRHWPE